MALCVAQQTRLTGWPRKSSAGQRKILAFAEAASSNTQGSNVSSQAGHAQPPQVDAPLSLRPLQCLKMLVARCDISRADLASGPTRSGHAWRVPYCGFQTEAPLVALIFDTMNL